MSTDATMAMPTRVLLVEDEFLIRDMVTEVLTGHGCEVHVAATAADALQHLTGGARCDVLFTDINLPGGVDGTRLAQLARQLRPGLPVVYASGLFSAIGQLEAVPDAVFVPKPYDPEKVWDLLRKRVSRH